MKVQYFVPNAYLTGDYNTLNHNYYLLSELISDISNWKKLPATNPARDPIVKIHMDMFYHGPDPQNPKVN